MGVHHIMAIRDRKTRPVSSPAGSRWTSSKPFPSSCPQTRANYSRGTGLFAVSNFPRLRVGQESCDFPSRGSAWDKNRAIFLPAAPRGTRIVRQFLPAAPREARIVRFSFPRLRVRLESCRETLPPFGRDKNRAAKPSRRVIWVRKQCF